MRISLVAAMAGTRRVIGAGGQLPWRLPADLRRFRALTLGKPVLMGRRTYQSIGKPLPGRHNIVLTRDPAFQAAGCTVAHDLDAALAAAGEADELMVIGGAEIYALLLPRAERQYLTLIDAEIEGDTCYPAHDSAEWEERDSVTHEPDDANPYRFRCVTLERSDGRTQTISDHRRASTKRLM